MELKPCPFVGEKRIIKQKTLVQLCGYDAMFAEYKQENTIPTYLLMVWAVNRWRLLHGIGE